MIQNIKKSLANSSVTVLGLVPLNHSELLHKVMKNRKVKKDELFLIFYVYVNGQLIEVVVFFQYYKNKLIYDVNYEEEYQYILNKRKVDALTQKIIDFILHNRPNFYFFTNFTKFQLTDPFDPFAPLLRHLKMRQVSRIISQAD